MPSTSVPGIGASHVVEEAARVPGDEFEGCGQGPLSRRYHMPKHEKIAVAAYQLWEKNPDSDAETNWLTAEAQLLAKTADNNLLNSPDVDNVGAPTFMVR